MTATTATTPAAATPAPRAAFVPRLISYFSGTTGLVVKIILLSTFNALAVWAAYVLVDRRHWIALGVLAVTTAGVDLIYLGKRRALPAKFIIPATLFMVAFQIVPILYTIQV